MLWYSWVMAFAQEIRVSRKDWWPLMKETELALTILVATIYDVHYLGIQVTCYPLTGHWWENLAKNAQIKCLFLFKSTSKQKENIDSLETVRHIPMEEDVTPRLTHFCSYATKVEKTPHCPARNAGTEQTLAEDVSTNAEWHSRLWALTICPISIIFILF